MELRKVLKGEFELRSCRYDVLSIDLGEEVQLDRKDIFICPKEDGDFKFLAWSKYTVKLSDGRNNMIVEKLSQDNFYQVLQFCVNHNINIVEVYKK